MKIFKTTLAIEGASGSIFKMDIIEHEGRMWLVPEWREMPSEGWKYPDRIICLDTIPHQKLPRGAPFGDFVLSGPLPKAVYEGRVPQQLADVYVVIETPNIRFPIPPQIH